MNVAMLVVVATGGYHDGAVYQWERDDSIMDEEVYPVIYVATRGSYSCTCKFNEVTVKLNFTVSGG